MGGISSQVDRARSVDRRWFLLTESTWHACTHAIHHDTTTHTHGVSIAERACLSENKKSLPYYIYAIVLFAESIRLTESRQFLRTMKKERNMRSTDCVDFFEHGRRRLCPPSIDSSMDPPKKIKQTHCTCSNCPVTRMINDRIIITFGQSTGRY